jgi:2-iminobutanoate/2-iminopropanoate deaminase
MRRILLLNKKVIRAILGRANHERSTLMKIISTKKAPSAIGPYSQAVVADGFVFTSGQIPLSPATGEVTGDNITAQSKQALANLISVLEAAGAGADTVIKTTCFLADMVDFAAFNEVYAACFPGNPARSCVAVRALPKNVLVEVEAVAKIK